jgi:hypothetical protein
MHPDHIYRWVNSTVKILITTCWFCIVSHDQFHKTVFSYETLKIVDKYPPLPQPPRPRAFRARLSRKLVNPYCRQRQFVLPPVTNSFDITISAFANPTRKQSSMACVSNYHSPLATQVSSRIVWAIRCNPQKYLDIFCWCQCPWSPNNKTFFALYLVIKAIAFIAFTAIKINWLPVFYIQNGSPLLDNSKVMLVVNVVNFSFDECN